MRPPILHAETSSSSSSSFGEEQITMVVVVLMMVAWGLTEEEGKNFCCRLILPRSPAQGDISAEVFAIRRTMLVHRRKVSSQVYSEVSHWLDTVSPALQSLISFSPGVNHTDGR
jgi:hypothetical protein